MYKILLTFSAGGLETGGGVGSFEKKKIEFRVTRFKLSQVSEQGKNK